MNDGAANVHLQNAHLLNFICFPNRIREYNKTAAFSNKSTVTADYILALKAFVLGGSCDLGGKLKVAFKLRRNTWRVRFINIKAKQPLSTPLFKLLKKLKWHSVLLLSKSTPKRMETPCFVCVCV